MRFTFRSVLVALVAAFALSTAVAVAPAVANAETGGEAVGWGRNLYGQLGGGFRTPSGGGEEHPVSVTGVKEITALASGQGSSERGFGLALLSNGTVEAWGSNRYGELGIDEGVSEESCAEAPEEEPVESEEGGEGEEEKALVPGLKEAKAISAAAAHDLALLSNGTVKTWGVNQDGEHGNQKGGNQCETGEPDGYVGEVEHLSDVESIASGGGADYALVNNGGATEVKAWGRDIEGRLGVEEPSKAQKTKEKEDVTKWKEEVALREYDKEHKITPLPEVHELPERTCNTEVGNQECSKEPRTVLALPKEVTEKGVKAHITAISAGATFALALYSNGTVRAWGSDGASQLGNNQAGGTHGDEREAEKVPGLGEGETFGPVVAIAAGKGEPAQGLALLANGKVVGWGNDNYGQLGSTTETCKDGVPCDTTPKQIAGLENITAISAGGGYSLALNAKGEMYSFGQNKYDRLGNGSQAESSDVPTLITGIGSVSTIAAGEISGFAILSNGVAGPAPMMSLTPGVDSLTVSWTFNPEPGKHNKVCAHLAKKICPYELKKVEEGVKNYTFTGLLGGTEYVVTVNNGKKTRAINGITLP